MAEIAAEDEGAAEAQAQAVTIPTLVELAGEATAALFAGAANKSERNDNIEALRGYPADIVRAILRRMPWQGLLPIYTRRDPTFSKHITYEVLSESMLKRERRLRQLFSLNPKALKNASPHTFLLEVFQHAPLFILGQWGEPTESPPPPPSMFSQLAPARFGRPSAVTDQGAFEQNWRAFSDGSLEGLDWTNVVAAGGAPLACLMPSPMEEQGRKLTSNQRKAWLSADQAWKLHRDGHGPRSGDGHGQRVGAAALDAVDADYRRHGDREHINITSDIDLFLYG